MLIFGIYSKSQYLSLGAERQSLGARVAYTLLRTGDHPSPEEIRMFEDICFRLHTSNGTFRTTFRERFKDLDAVVLRRLKELFPASQGLRVEDRAVSNGLTSAEWYRNLAPAFPAVQFEASDLLMELIELSVGKEIYITEPSGQPLQYIRPPYVVSLSYPEPWRNPILRWIAARARKKFARFPPGGQRRSISCVHPEARMLQKATPHFRFVARSVFQPTAAGCDVLRTMNILNRSYFSPQKLEEGARAIFDSVVPGGLWIVGRTLEEDFSNHATLFRRLPDGWEVLDRIGKGSDIEEVALHSLVRA